MKRKYIVLLICSVILVLYGCVSKETDPEKIHVVSTPTQTIIVSITADGKSKTVTCKDIAFGEAKQARNKKGREFIEVIDEVVDIITNTEEWKSLPDYEFGYD